MPHVREGDEGEVDGVEHELDRHEDGDEVALDEEGCDADGEEDGGEDEVVGGRNPLFNPPGSGAKSPGNLGRGWLRLCRSRRASR